MRRELIKKVRPKRIFFYNESLSFCGVTRRAFLVKGNSSECKALADEAAPLVNKQGRSTLSEIKKGEIAWIYLIYQHGHMNITRMFI